MAAAPVLQVAAGLVFRSGRLLITRRPAGAHLGGLWEFPGGKLEPGETWEQGLIRELREELGISVAVGRLLSEVRHDYPGKSVHLRFHVCTLLEGEPRPLECEALEWVTREELALHSFPEADRQVLVAAAAAPEFHGESL